MKTSKRKRIVLVNRELQFKLSLFGALVGLVSSIIGVLLILYPLYVFEVIRISNFLPLPVYFVIGLSILVNSGFVILFGIHITHKIVGPIYGLIRKLRQVEKGDWSVKMRSRDTDELKYLVRNYNNMIEGLQQQAKDEIFQLEKIKNLITKDSSSKDEDLIQMIESLTAKLNRKIAQKND